MSNKKNTDEVILDITVIPEKIKIGHIRIMSAAGQKKHDEPIHEVLDALQEITEEDIFDYPLDAIPAIVEAVGSQMNEIANPESSSGN
ncbi:MAG: hypothetical protein JRE40_00025 [Deltaproteobacteria bacterium]|nr:hypothetical protein [Deltaproteobacteria bacterium]